MPSLRGVVQQLLLTRSLGWVSIRPEEDEYDSSVMLGLYKDVDGSMIDPTEMVRRNWMIGLLKQALTDGLLVDVDYEGLPDYGQAVVWSVALTSEIPSEPLTLEATTRGTVRDIAVTRDTGKVTVRSLGRLGLATPVDHRFFIYDDTAGGRFVGRKEADRRRHMISLLREALKGGLEVSIDHAHETNAYIEQVTLLATE